MATTAAIPKHVGYIVDGNRRWAKKHGLPAYEGHLAGYNAIQDVAKATFNAGVEFMSAYIFSTENWKRSEQEVQALMGLVLKLFTSDLYIFQEENIRLRILGSKQGVSEKILAAIDSAEEATRENTRGTLALCFNYGGQLEVADAVKNFVSKGGDAGRITVKDIENNLYAADIPPLDLIIRTSGEERLSNFMLYRAAYSELMFLPKAWPDMTKEDVALALKEYANRGRRFGQ